MSTNFPYPYSPISNSNENASTSRETELPVMAGGKLDKFILLMWKNSVLQYRRPLQMIIEILAPVLFSILLVLIRYIAKVENYDHSDFSPISLKDTSYFTNNSNQQNFSLPSHLILLISPDKIIPNDLAQMCDGMNLTCKGLPNAAAMNDYYNNDATNVLAGIQFEDDVDLKSLSNSTIYLRFPAELRSSATDGNWRTSLLYPIYQVPGPRQPDSPTGANPNYFKEGFLHLQYAVSTLIKLSQSNHSADWVDILSRDIQIQRFTYGKWQDDVLLQALPSMLGLVMLLSYVYPCINTVKSITYEKERQLKEAMKIMGLPNWLHWSAWFIKSFVLLFISNILIVILLKVNWYSSSEHTVFTYADPSVILVFLLLYCSATVTYCFAISVFFSKANTAGTIAGLAWFLSYFPYMLTQQNYDQTTLSTKLFGSLGSNSAMGYGFQVMIMFEGTGEGISWSNLNEPTNVDDTLTLFYVMVMLFIDIFLYLAIALYVEAVFPGEYGVPQPWYFPFTASYWCGKPRVTSVEDMSHMNNHNSEFFEEEPGNLHAGIQIKQLRKVFSKNKIAVRGLSLNMYEDQITVLLGHNGAGKTTTMSMLTGMFPPSSGTALVNGYDIKTDIQNVRSSLGLCPQHNILFDDLTVKEHLYFFSKLKGMSNKKQIEAEIQKYVEMLELVPKADARSSTLSGGMKRKLCVGIALCANSKVVMLDEPTAGMDPSARRALWDLLLNQKQSRTMLLSTHFMDEADLLGDRIAIMAGGQLQCCGSSFFLKKKYGAGYHLVMDKASHCDAIKVTRMLKKYIPTVEIESNIGSELSYELPENQVGVFENMLRDVEHNAQSLGVNSYGISLTTLEEVFMKVGADHGQEEQYNEPEGVKPANSNSDLNSTSLTMGHSQLLTGWPLMWNQIKSMFMKKYLSTVRTYILQIIQLLMPVVFMILAIVTSQVGDKALPELEITLDKYTDPITLVSNTADSENFAKRYCDSIQESSHVCTMMGTESKLEEEMIRLSEDKPSVLRRQYLIAASFNGPTSKAWFNNDPLHTPPLALSHLLNAVYDLNLKFVNKPFEFSVDSKVKQLQTGQTMGFQIAFNIGFSMAFVSSFYILFCIRERVSKSKHLQFVSGVNVYFFWIVSFICDMLTFIVTAIGLVITLACFQEDGFKTGEELGRVFAILLFSGWSMIPMMYFASRVFDVPSSGYSRMTMVSIFLGNAAFMIITILSSPDLDLEDVGKALHWVFLLVPHYSMISGISNAYTMYAFNEICDFSHANGLYNVTLTGDLTCNDIDDHYFRWADPGIGRNLFFSMLLGAIFFTLVILLDQKVFAGITSTLTNIIKKKPVPPPPEDEDDDVLNEKERIRNATPSELQNNNILALRDVTKYYKNFLAVNSLCLGVKKYECFGLLGVNGAGKTTTFKMMTGDEDITYGDAWVNGYSLRADLKQVQKYIGYCPQFDALLDDLTARETLKMFSLLRGVANEDIDHLVVKLSTDFDFRRHLDKQVKELSGGNKRKLSTAISLIGDPPILYLDEPTTGMDVATKRYLWNALCQVRDNGKSIVLTSHSMEECEALCTRLAIMVNGTFKCLGSTQHLKNKYAQSFSLTIKVKKVNNQMVDTTPIERFVVENFRNVELREKHQEFLSYYLNDKSFTWSQMFGIMERGKRANLNIEDYALGQSSLEQVFLSFTKFQYTIGE